MSHVIYSKIKEFLANKEIAKIDLDTSFALAKDCSLLLASSETEELGRDLIIRVLDVWDKINDSSKPMWNDIVEASGLHPYVSESYLSGPACMRREYFKSKHLNNVYMHEEQMSMALELHAAKSVVLSAPTSFGKSLLIHELVASCKYKNIVIIQPTLALLDETRKKLKEYADLYNIIITTSQKPCSDRNIFLFTGERVVEYQFFPTIDFFVIDEFYKLSLDRDDERAATLNHALYKLLGMTKNFYMLGPHIKSISPQFIQKYGAVWHRTDFATVAVDVEQMYSGGKRKNEPIKEKVLHELLRNLKEPTLVYCSAPNKVNQLVEEFIDHVESNAVDYSDLRQQEPNELSEWIGENIHKQWALNRAMQWSVAYHHGAMPRHISSAIVDLFNQGKIKYLFCTSSLIEGVNTAAKNVVIYDQMKGLKAIDYFDFKNIVGRSGRMKKHFIGKVFQFDKEPKQLEFDVDIPLFSQSENTPLELLVQVDKKDLSVKSKAKLEPFRKLNHKIQDVIRSNVGMSIEGQINILNYLEQNAENLHDSMSWTGMPEYKQLESVIDLAWKNLLRPRESRGGIFSAKQLTNMAFNYGLKKSIRALINREYESEYSKKRTPDDYERLQKSIQTVLQVSMHWFDYKLPKWLTTVSNIQSYVFESKGMRPGNYAFYSGYLENDFLPAHLTVLTEYGIPVTAIRKLEAVLKAEMPIDDMKKELKKTGLKNLNLMKYEENRLRDFVG